MTQIILLEKLKPVLDFRENLALDKFLVNSLPWIHYEDRNSSIQIKNNPTTGVINGHFKSLKLN